ncbi:hypothetical protein OAS43_01615 [Candidatus Pelagibacter sp.]|nr:hypothetical protein [Candidatus Pelagibacter sp.]
MSLIINKIYRFVLSIISIIKINYYIFKQKKNNKNIKIIFFYFPVKIYQDNILELIDEIKKEKNLEVILGFNAGTSQEIKKKVNSFFLNLGYLRYIKNIDIFLSSYVIYNFPISNNKVYINHDIYDTPMVNKDKEEELIKSLNKCDYIFLSSEISVENLKNKFDRYLNDKKDINNTQFINTGYLKLDHVNKKFLNKKKIEDSILLAPTLSSMFYKYNLSSILENLIEKILFKNEFKLIYRPHPGDIKNEKQKKTIEKIYKKYKNNENFILDSDISYLESYERSKILITDFSGTAYTYAFSTLKPVIFISRNEGELVNSEYNNLYFFKDRPLVGKIVDNLNNLNPEIINIINDRKIFSEKIKLLRTKRIKYFNCSIEQNLYNIKNILKI